jgi:hypothetical protein
MRKSTKIFGAVAVAGLIAAGTSAFTASNTFDDGSDVVGSGTVTATGIAVDGVEYNVSDGVVHAVSFGTMAVLDESSVTIQMRLLSAGTPATNGDWDESECVYTDATNSIVCTLDTGVAVAAFTTTELTVIDDEN